MSNSKQNDVIFETTFGNREELMEWIRRQAIIAYFTDLQRLEALAAAIDQIEDQ